MTHTVSTVSSGQVKWFNVEKGFGFIQCTSINKDVFLHVKQLRASGIENNLTDGEAVTFICNTGPKGLFATNISRSKGESNAPTQAGDITGVIAGGA